jgi:hypothetical protein
MLKLPIIYFMINNLIESLTLVNVNGVPICDEFCLCRFVLSVFLIKYFASESCVRRNDIEKQ